MADSSSQPTSEALFRYLVVSAVLTLVRQGQGRQAAVRQVAAGEQLFEDQLRRVSVRTVWRWLKAYEERALPGLERAPRPRIEGSAVLPEAFLDFLSKERQADARASIPELIRRARLAGVLHPVAKVDRVTVFRAMQRRAIATRPLQGGPDGGDVRRFAFPERLQLVMLDFVHFRAGTGRLRRTAVYLLDDATRYGLGVAVASAEPAVTVIGALAAAIRQYGRMVALYWDRGSGFRDRDLLAICAQLGVHAIFGTERYPQARGKIERFNRSARARILRALGRAEVDPSFAALELRLRHDLGLYNALPHESLSGATPESRFFGSTRPLDPVPSEAWLVEKLTLPLSRRLSRDGVISFGGQAFEVPRQATVAGQKAVEVLRRVLEGDALYVRQQDRLIRLHPVDLTANAYSRRSGGPPQTPVPDPAPPPKTASMLAFELAHQSLLGPDGGFPSPHTALEEIDDHE